MTPDKERAGGRVEHLRAVEYLAVLSLLLAALYLAGFLVLECSGALDLATLPWKPRTDAWWYKLYKPLHNVWPL